MIEAALIFLGGLSLAIWLFLAFFRGGFWRADQRLTGDAEPGHWPEVVAVIPARNEAPTIGITVASLLEQNYPGKLSVVVVDDNSDDGNSGGTKTTNEN